LTRRELAKWWPKELRLDYPVTSSDIRHIIMKGCLPSVQMGVRVIADGMPRLPDPVHQLRVFLRMTPDQKKRRSYIEPV
jgi:hypothetical protein